jgi:hypothetical protein
VLHAGGDGVPPLRTWLRRPWLAGLLALTAAFHAAFIWSASFTVRGHRTFVLFDDAMISMRYARNLVHGHGLAWNEAGPRVEGITNPAWTLWMAVVHLLPLPDRLISVPVMLTGVALVLGTVVNVARLTALLTEHPLAPPAAAVLTAAFFPLAFWSLRGMEVGAVSFLVVTGVFLVVRDPGLELRTTRRWMPVVIVGLVATRLDAALPAALLVVGACAAAPRARRRRVALWLGGTLAATLAALTVARLAYYGDALPNTYYLKVTGIPLDVRLRRGWQVLRNIGVESFGAYVLLAAGALVAAVVRRNTRYLLPLAIVGTGVAYSVWVGGDAWEELGFPNRYLTSVIPLLFAVAGAGAAEWVAGPRRKLPVRAVALGLGIAGLALWMAARAEALPRAFRQAGPTLADSVGALRAVAVCAAVAGLVVAAVARRPRRDEGGGPRAAAPVARGVALGAVVALAVVGANHLEWRRWADTGIPLADADERWARDGLRYRRSTTPEATIAFSAAGNQGYFSERPAIDLLGKSDRRIARERPRTEDFRPGHNKFDYAWSIGHLQPDLVASAGFGVDVSVLPLLDRWGYHVAGTGDLVRNGTRRVDETELGPRPGEAP